MKETFKRTAYRRWKKKGLVTKDPNGTEFLMKDHKMFKLMFSEGKVLLEDSVEGKLSDELESNWNKENAKPDSFFNIKVNGCYEHRLKECSLCFPKKRTKKDKGRKKSGIQIEE